MQKLKEITGPISRFSISAAWISFVTAAIFIVLLISLHFIEPDFDPSWRFISEYELGNYGWIMQIAFILFAISHIGLFWAIRSFLKDIVGRIGLFLLLVNIAGLLLAGIFISDSLLTNPDSITINGKLHNLGGTLGIAGLFATILMSWKLIHNKIWLPARQSVFWATILVIIGFFVSTLSIFFMLSQSDGKFGPEVLVGLPNRFGILTACIWILVVSSSVTRINSQKE